MSNLTKLIVLGVILVVLLGALWFSQRARHKELTKVTRQQIAAFFPDLDGSRVFRIEISTLPQEGRQSLLLRKQAGVWEVALGRDVLGEIIKKGEEKKEESEKSAGSTESIITAGQGEPVEPPSEKETTPPDPRSDVGPQGDQYRSFYKADPDTVKKMIDAFVNLKRGELVTTDESKQSQLKVLNNIVGTEVVFYDEQMNKLAHLIIGEAGPGFKSCFVRQPDSNEIYKVSENLKIIFETNLMSLRDKKIFTAAPETFMSLKIVDHENNSEINLSRVEGQWKGTDGEGNTLELSAEKVDDLLNAVGSLSANSFVDPNDPMRLYSEKSEEDPYGLAKPVAEIQFTTSDNVSHTLTIGKSEGTTFYAVADGRINDVFRLSSSVVKSIRPTPQSLKGEEKVEAEKISSSFKPESGTAEKIPYEAKPAEGG